MQYRQFFGFQFCALGDKYGADATIVPVEYILGPYGGPTWWE